MIQSSPPRDQRSEQDEIFSNHSLDLQTFELIKCPTHPNYRVEAFSAKDTLKSNLLCIKCILSPDISKEIRGDLIAIKDLISKTVEQGASSQYRHETSASQKPPDSFDKKFLEFNQRDYIGIFDRHVETQMERLDKEIERVKESLGKLREQFVKFFEKQGQMLKSKDEELKQKAMQYFEEREELEKRSFGSINNVLKELNTIEQFEDYEKFIHLLFKKSALGRRDQDGSLSKKLVSMMEDVRVQASNLKGMRIDTQILQEIRDGIESINILDKATVVAGVAPLNKSLERTLEKIRKVERSPTSIGKVITSPVQLLERKGKDSHEKISPYADRELQKPSTLSQTLKEKYGVEVGKKSTPTQDRESGYTPKKQNFHERERDRDFEPKEVRDFGGHKMWESFTSTSNLASKSYVQGFTSTDAKKAQYESRSPYFGHEAKKTANKRMIIEKEGSDSEDIEEGGRPTKRLLPQDRSFSFQAQDLGKSSRMDIERTKPGYSQSQSQQTFSQGSQQQRPDQYRKSSTSPYRLESGTQEQDFRLSPKFAKASFEKQSSSLFDSKSTEKKIETSKSQSKDHKDSVSHERQKDEQSKDQSALNKSGSKEISKNTPTAEDSRGSLINQWIDQKVNGFLVFQNTLRDQAGQSVEDFTKYCSEKWFHLSKPERDEYTSLALKIRAELKQEFKDLTLDTSDLSQLQELLDQRIKTFKK